MHATARLDPVSQASLITHHASIAQTHCIYRYEVHGQSWSAREDMSCSLIYAAQHSAPTDWVPQLPLFSGGGGERGGIILRPGATPIACGKAADAGGHCFRHHWCPHIDPEEVVNSRTVGEHTACEHGFRAGNCLSMPA